MMKLTLLTTLFLTTTLASTPVFAQEEPSGCADPLVEKHYRLSLDEAAT